MVVDAAYEEELKERLKTKWSKHAFNCAKCPKEGCPAWGNVYLDDVQRGRRVLAGCGFVLSPLYHNLNMGMALGAMQTAEASAKKIE